MPHLHEQQGASSVLLLQNEEHSQHSFLCTLLRTVETDLGLGHLEQITDANPADWTLDARLPSPSIDADALAALFNYQTPTFPLFYSSNVANTTIAVWLPDQFGSWVGSRRGPPCA